jgi:hypothetical protein
MGYHNDDGRMYESSGGDKSSKGTGRFYQEGDVVGCGISWNEESVYYTLNGKRIGEWPLPPRTFEYRSLLTSVLSQASSRPNQYTASCTLWSLYVTIRVLSGELR